MTKKAKSLLGILAAVLALTQLINADIAPGPNERRVSANLIIETAEDLTDYRFFVDFYGAVHEIEIKGSSQTSIPPLGGGARYSSGTLLAIPKKNLNDYSEKIISPYQEPGKNLSDAIAQKKIEGIIQLGKHQFSAVIKKSQEWTSPTYKIEKENGTLKLIKSGNVTSPTSSERKGGGIDFAIYGISKSLTPSGYIFIIGFPTVAIILLGIWLFRRKGRKLG